MKNDFDIINDYHKLKNYVRINCNHVKQNTSINKTIYDYKIICDITKKDCIPSINCVEYNNFKNKEFIKLYKIVNINLRNNKIKNLIKNDK